MSSPVTTAKSAQSRRSAEMMAAASIRNGSGPQKYAASLCHLLSVRSAIVLEPYCARRCAASADYNPAREVFSFWSTAATLVVADVVSDGAAATCSLVMARPTLLPIVSIKATRLPSVALAEVSALGTQRRQKPVFSLGWTEHANRPTRRKFADERGRTEYRLVEGIGL